MIHYWMLCKTLLLFDSCIWLVEEEDAETVGKVLINYHRPLTNKLSWKLLVWRLLHLYRLVQLGAGEGQVTSKGSRHIILRTSGEEGIRWWLTIGFDRSRKYWRLWRSPPMW